MRESWRSCCVATSSRRFTTASTGCAPLKELGRSYVTITQDLARVMSRIKALYRSWAIACSGTSVYAPRHRAEWLDKIPEPGVRLRAERLYQHLDLLQPVRPQ